MQFFLSCARGLEPLAVEEIQALNLSNVHPAAGGCWFDGSIADAQRVMLWSRVGSRVLLPLFDALADGEGLTAAASEFDWADHLLPGSALAIDFSGTNAAIRHTHYGALCLKDGIADWHRAAGLELPQMSADAPLRLSARIEKNHISVALDLCGEGLHRRGYRERQGIAPLRETLAAGLLYRAGWPEIATAGGNFVDPMCGSGTLVIEAAMMAADRAPGLKREVWGIDYWAALPAGSWGPILEEAEERFHKGRESLQNSGIKVRGLDIDARVLHSARDNASRAGIHNLVEFERGDIADLAGPDSGQGLLMANPPYGERLGETQQALAQYELLGELLARDWLGWRAALLAPGADFGRATRLHSFKNYQFYNGALECRLYLFDVRSDSKMRDKSEAAPSAGAQMVADRIRKNRAKLKKWVAREHIGAHRIYDADIPEYSAAIDWYPTSEGHFAVVQEYAAPKTVDANKARHRFNEICTGVALALELPDSQIIRKVRQRQRGSEQYQALESKSGEELEILEGNARLLVNLTDYLDTGLFLDHRPVRRFIAMQAKGKRFLNLFSYTATATVHAALGGASNSLSLDMSNTYLDWAQRNFATNNLSPYQHRLRREDCVKWLYAAADGETWDLILLDPPTFSNSTRMEDTLDIQRDHADLIAGAMARLAARGLLIFSTNLRRFRLDEAVSQRYRIEDWNRSSIDPDFERNPRIHQCFLIRHV